MNVSITGTSDTFAKERLPAAHELPELHFDLPRCSIRNVSTRQRSCSTGALRGAAAQTPVHRRAREASAGATRTCAHAANRIANVLVGRLAIAPGNRVLLRAPNTPMLAACWFAVLKAGGIAVTTVPLYRAAELRFMMEKAQVKHALCDFRLRDELDLACRRHCRRADALLQRGCGARGVRWSSSWKVSRRISKRAQTAAEDVAIIAFTSGTTGTPKAAMHYHRDVLAICDTYCDRVLQPRPTISSAEVRRWHLRLASGGLLLFPLHAGAATLMLEKAGPIDLLEAIAAFGVTTIFTAPVAYRTMAAKSAGVRSIDAAHVRFGRRDAAESRLGAVARNDGVGNSRRHRQHGDAPYFRRFAAA